MIQVRLLPNSRIGKAIVLVILGVIFLPLIYSRITHRQRAIKLRSSTSASYETSTDLQITPEKQTESQSLNDDLAETNTLSIASFNIAHGRGLADSNLKGGTVAQRMQRLVEIAKLLRDINADVVVLNEVDFDSQWSGSINQAEFLAKHSGYGWWVEQRNMDFRIALCNWAFGNAVLSKYPIKKAELIELPGHSSVESIMLGQKQGVACEVEHPNGSIQVIGAHLSQRSEAVRVHSAKIAIELAQKSFIPTFFVGDLNSSPSGFHESVQNERGENAIDVLQDSGVFQRWSQIKVGESSYCTFHSSDPTMVIDWIFAPNNWQFLDYQVLPKQLSDHRLIHAKLRLK